MCLSISSLGRGGPGRARAFMRFRYVSGNSGRARNFVIWPLTVQALFDYFCQLRTAGYSELPGVEYLPTRAPIHIPPLSFSRCPLVWGRV